MAGVGGVVRRPEWVLLAMLLTGAPRVGAQSSPIFATDRFHAIRAEASGERPLADFAQIVARFSGYSPSKGGDGMADYIAGRLRAEGLDEVRVEGYPSDGRTFVWAFLGEPAWEARSATLTMVEPRTELLADFSVHRVVLGRYSTSADVTATLLDVGPGTRPEDYAGKDVQGRIVLADGDAQTVHAEAVWRRGARGVVWIRKDEAPDGSLVSSPNLGNKTGVAGDVPWRGPNDEAPGFLFGVSMAQGTALRTLARRGPVVVRAVVDAATGPGEFKQVEGVIRGTDPAAREVWVKAHTNYRNTGGGNNLTGVGATLEIARVLNALIARGELPRPRRTIRFSFSAEHYGATYQFYFHPERLARPFTFFSVDMTGFDQKKVNGVFRVYRTPYSRPHFLSDVVEEFTRRVAHANTSQARHGGFPDPTFAPTGSRDAMGYSVEPFWAPSDHEEMVEGSIGIPSVEFGHADRYLGTQEDGLDKTDATQMRRSVLTIASAAYYLASATGDQVPALLSVIVEQAHGRLGAELGRALTLVARAASRELPTQYREAVNVLTQAAAREHLTLDSLSELGLTPAATAAVAQVRRHLLDTQLAHEALLRTRAEVAAASGGVSIGPPAPTAEEARLAGVVPQRTGLIRGPLNLWRPEFGSIWVARRTGNRDVLGAVKLTRAGRFVAYEALNFVDGRRTLLDIRDAVSAEYGPLDAGEVEQYFEFLAQLGVVSLAAVSGAPVTPPAGVGLQRR